MAAWEFLKTHIWIIPLALTPLFFLLLRGFLQRRKRRKAEEELTQLKRRDEALSDALRNPLVKKERRTGEDAMEIVWDEKAVTKKKGDAEWMAELIELSGYSRRKYVLRMDEPIRIGSTPENRLSLPREGVAAAHCEIFMNGPKPCVRSAPGVKTFLRRGRNSALIGQDGIYLQNGDRIQAGSSEIQFRLFKA